MILFIFLFGPAIFLCLIACLSFNFFKRGGEEVKTAFIPGLNIYTWLKLIDKPWWWMVLLFIPILNFLMVFGFLIELQKAFGRYQWYDYVLGVFLFWIYLPFLNFATTPKYYGPFKETKVKSSTREWVEAIMFAVVAATIIRTFFVEAYTIPTPSMEKTLLVGDFLFVSKVHYGARVPMTPISFPFAHNTMPIIGGKSYLEWIQFPYRRLPGFQEIEREDMVVFNYPTDENRRPVDKKENYIKRCVALPGDEFEMKEGFVYINGEASEQYETIMYNYIVQTTGDPISPRHLREMGITEWESISGHPGYYVGNITISAAEKLEELSVVESVQQSIARKGDVAHLRQSMFPGDSRNFPFNVDNFGPVTIPAAGQTVNLNAQNIRMYELIISDYEKNDLRIQGDQIYINGEVADTYTFEMDYYFMVGDNRHNSADSRMWGFVPHDHVVGKAWLIWMSLDRTQGFFPKIRWNRLFTPIH